MNPYTTTLVTSYGIIDIEVVCSINSWASKIWMTAKCNNEDYRIIFYRRTVKWHKTIAINGVWAAESVCKKSPHVEILGIMLEVFRSDELAYMRNPLMRHHHQRRINQLERD